MLVVADASALIAVATYEGLFLLDVLFQEVAVPQAVYEECVKEGKPEAQRLSKYLQGKVIPTKTQRLNLPNYLGRGEVEAMQLCLEKKASYLLIDDRRARKVAQLNQIKTLGSLGLLLIAKEKKHIEKVSPFLVKLKNSSLYFSEALFKTVLQKAGE